MRLLLSVLIVFLHLHANAQNYSSTIFIPISVEKSAVKEVIDASTEDVLTLADSLEMSKYSFDLDILDRETKLWENTISHTIEFVGGQGKLSNRTGIKNPIPYGGKLYSPWITLSCNEIKGFSTADITVNITPDYEIKTESSFTADIKNAKCNGIRMNKAMRMLGYDTMSDTMSYKMNEILSEMDLRGQIEQIWFDMQKPVEVDSNTYIIIEPEKLIYEDFYFAEDKLNFGIGIQMKMGVSNKEDAKQWNIFKPLPLLEKIDTHPTDLVHINSPIKIDYKTIEAQMKQQLVGEYIKKDENKKCKKNRIAQVQDIVVEGSELNDFDMKIGAKVKFLKYFKKKEGFIYFHCNPYYDKELGRVEVRNYKVDSQVNSWLANTAIEAGANTFFKKKMQETMMADINNQIELVRTTLNDYIKDEVKINEGTTFKGEIDSFEIQQFSARQKDLFMILDLKGDIQINMYEIPAMEE